MLLDDQRVFKTKTGSVYELAGDPVNGWVEYAGSGGIDDFAPFDVTVFGKRLFAAGGDLRVYVDEPC